MRKRAEQLQDVGLDREFVERLRGGMSAALLNIHAELALNAAAANELSESRRHLRLIRKSGMPAEMCDQVIRASLMPVRDRIKAAMESAEARWKRTPHHGGRFVREMHANTAQLLEVVDAMLPPDDLTRASIHDAVAEAILKGQINFGNKTEEWKESLELLRIAEEIAIGPAIRERINRNLEIVEGNTENEESWCSPGYWDLEEDQIELLESARAEREAGNPEQAIQQLIVLDPAMGSPLRRCLAAALDSRGWQLSNQAIDAYNEPESNLKRFLDEIGRLGTVSRPDPQMSSWQLPNCVSCGSRSYSQWTNGEFRGQPYWLCASCVAGDERELERKKASLREGLSHALEHILLAAKVDKVYSGSAKLLKEKAGKVNTPIPKTRDLERRLSGGQRGRGLPKEFEQSDARTCFFCHQDRAVAEASIQVPMCGEVRQVELLFGQGQEFRHGTVVVPRCPCCRDEHRDLPGRIERWQEDRLGAADDHHFEDLVRAAHTAQVAARPAQTRIQSLQEEAEEARAVIDPGGGKPACHRCKGVATWRKGLCTSCDDDLHGIGSTLAFVFGVAVLTVVTLIELDGTILGSTRIEATLPLVSTASLALSLVTFGGMKSWRDSRRRRRKEALLVEAKELRAAAEERLADAEKALKEERRSSRRLLDAERRSRKRLEQARAEAIPRFEKAHPEPVLAAGVAPEEQWRQHELIAELVDEGWGYGSELIEGGAPASDPTGAVLGLVDRPPAAPAPRSELDCPSCGASIRVQESDTLLDHRCCCGEEFQSLHGLVYEEPASGTPRAARAALKKLAREAAPGQLIPCPVCSAKVSGKNMIRHVDKVHPGFGGGPAPAAPVGDPPEHYHQMRGGSCTACGCSATAISALSLPCLPR